MYWYRLEQGLGRFSIVGTTVKHPERLPQDLVADEKHSWLKGQRIYIATTAAKDCILGASVSLSASQTDLEKAYVPGHRVSIAVMPRLSRGLSS